MDTRRTQAAFRERGLLATRLVNLVEKPVIAGLAGAPVPVVQVEPVGHGKLTGRVSPVSQRLGVPRATTPPAFMSFDAFCRLVGGLLPPLELRLAGDEDPLLHPRLFDMAAFAAARGLTVTAVTRMPGLGAARAEACARSGLQRLHVLVDCVPSALVQRSLERLDDAKRRLGVDSPEVLLASPEGPPVGAAPSQRYRFTGEPWSM